jgi:CRP/FNR family cyclic AMP-dependent transcriptional regulator
MTDQKILNSIQQDLGNFLTPEELKIIFSHAEEKTFSEGQVILQQGKYTQGFYLLVQGTVLVTAKMLGEGITQLETLEHGNFFGEVSFIENIPCTTSMTASNEVHCLYITAISIEFLTAYHPEIKYHLYSAIYRQVCSRISKVYHKITKFISTAGMPPRSFLGEFIQSLTKADEITFEEAGINIEQLHQFPIFKPFTQEEISYLLMNAVLLKAPKRCTLLHNGEVYADSFIVIRGAVQSSISHEKKVAKLSVIGPETLFTTLSRAEDLCDAITFTTCEPSIILKLSNTHLSSIKKEHPMVWYKIYDLICLSIVALEKSIDKLDIRLNIETYNR